MKKKLCKKLSILLICAMGLFLVACGKDNNTGNNSNADENVGIEEDNNSDDTTDDTANESGAITGSETGAADTTDDTNTSGTDDANTAGQVGTPGALQATDNPINDKITGYYSETVAYPALETEVIDELEYDNLDMSKTRYYYNYVDLNDDGTDEIIMQLNGENNTTKDGDTLLIIEQERDDDNEGNEFDVKEQFTAFVNPVIVSDNKTNGHKDLIFMVPDGDKTVYKKVVYGKDGYKKMSDAVVLENIDDVTGVALLCNDIAADNENGTGLFFT